MSRRVLTVLIVATMFVAFMPEQTAAQRGLDSASTSFVLPGDRPVRIMPVGDSNTKGRGSDVGSEEGWEQDDPLYVGYREALGELLAAAGVSFEFVGSQTGDGAGPHEGYGGKTPTYIASSIFGLLQDNPADVVLLMIGTNDLKSDDVKEILNRIDEWEQANHPVMVFMALIVNRKTTEVGERYIGSHQNQPGVDTHDFNSELRGIADDRPSDYLAVVDMERGFGIDYREAPAGHMSRDLPHLGIPSLNPNDLHLSTAAKGPGMLSGHEKVAHAWMTALCQELFGCPIVDSFTLVNADT
ncbi:MAG: hypothetical protein QNJ77_14305, partial [Acidimicrobiia bacterium]|nr:hypothetical protein [Acidimicrobiia bacterium]